MKLLSSRDLVGFIKERQAKQVRSLKQGSGVNPKLAIIYDSDDDGAIQTYMRMKKRYGEEMGIIVDVVKSEDIAADIDKYNQDSQTHGIIVQLPIKNWDDTEELVSKVALHKDVDGLVKSSDFDPATPTAILWLIAGHNIDLKGKNIHLIGEGRLVGSPLARMLESGGHELTIHTLETGPIDLKGADLVITATGAPGLLKSAMIPEGIVVVDAGTASAKSEKRGDLDDDVYEREDLTVTPRRGGVGPLTVCALFENVIAAARKSTE